MAAHVVTISTGKSVSFLDIPGVTILLITHFAIEDNIFLGRKFEKNGMSHFYSSQNVTTYNDFTSNLRSTWSRRLWSDTIFQ